ncbi:putative Protein NLRC3 [Paratrimastix pyriformis]|uniref:Uncharacterized protein n=1 Tax=Paratrimastix pyriformis TaxID=342808 RepID=A0ABQ8UE13_9EUKA|nr:putative Protein NLRC3 [Paratrimastix pyriformis]
MRPLQSQEDRFLQLLDRTCAGRFFDLRENGLGPAATDVLVRALRGIDQYTVINLGGNNLRDPGARSVSALLENNGAPSCVHLDLRSNDIGVQGGVDLFTALQSNDILVSLDLSAIAGANRNHIGVRGCIALSECLLVNKVLAVLNLQSNGIGAEGMSYLAGALQEGCSLDTIDLTANSLGWEGATLLAQVLGQTSLVRLDLSRNEIGDRGAAEVALALRHSLEGAAEAEGERNPIIPWMRRILVERAVARARRPRGDRPEPLADRVPGRLPEPHPKAPPAPHPRWPSPAPAPVALPSGGAAGPRLVVAGSTPVGPRIRDEEEDDEEADRGNACPLHTLIMTHNLIGERGAKVLGQVLRTNGTLVQLDLSHNGLGPNGAAALGRALTENRTLTGLLLNHCNALKTNTALVRLELAHNAMTDGGISALAEALRTNMSLQQIDLTSNNVQDPGGTELARALLSNACLKRLILASNNLADVAVGALVDTLRTNSTLLEVDISLNNAPYQLLMSLEHLIAENTRKYRSAHAGRLQDELAELQLEVAHLEATRGALAQGERKLEAAQEALVQTRECLDQTQAAKAQHIRELVATFDENMERLKEIDMRQLEVVRELASMKVDTLSKSAGIPPAATATPARPPARYRQPSQHRRSTRIGPSLELPPPVLFFFVLAHACVPPPPPPSQDYMRVAMAKADHERQQAEKRLREAITASEQERVAMAQRRHEALQQVEQAKRAVDEAQRFYKESVQIVATRGTGRPGRRPATTSRTCQWHPIPNDFVLEYPIKDGKKSNVQV